jgi:hypothetical protein
MKLQIGPRSDDYRAHQQDQSQTQNPYQTTGFPIWSKLEQEIKQEAQSESNRSQQPRTITINVYGKFRVLVTLDEELHQTC